MKLSTIILNWNRSHLLSRTIQSYLDTVGTETELFVVDNASTDSSRDKIADYERRGLLKAIYLDSNIGGDAYNIVIPQARGDLIYLSENDQELLPGWFEHVLDAFRAYSDLGQLSLFSDTPTDEEAWTPKSTHLRFAAGKILYQAKHNLGTSSIIPTRLFREGLRVKTLPGEKFRFPADVQLSADIKSKGLWCGFSERYYVRNLGHSLAEFEANIDYYEENYSAKPQVGVSGWRERIARQKAIPKFQRHCLALNRNALPEKTPITTAGKPSRLWSMFDGFTAETEVVDFLYALTRLVKPQSVLETGTWLGFSAIAIARGLEENGFGKLTTLEIDDEVHGYAMRNIGASAYSSRIRALRQTSLEFEPEGPIDLLLLDSDLAARGPEFERFSQWLHEHSIVVFHDTATHHVIVRKAIDELIQKGRLSGLYFPTPRGLFVGRFLA